jgi:hypothetical protein
MSARLQILVSEGLDRQIAKAAQRRRLSKSAWVRRAIEAGLAADRTAGDALDRLAGLSAPTGDIEQLLTEIEAGRGA